MIVRGEKAQASGGFLGVVILIAGLGLAYWIWPSGRLAEATFVDLLRVLGSCLMALLSVWVSWAIWVD